MAAAIKRSAMASSPWRGCALGRKIDRGAANERARGACTVHERRASSARRRKLAQLFAIEQIFGMYVDLVVHVLFPNQLGEGRVLFDAVAKCFFGKSKPAANGVDRRAGCVGDLLHRVAERDAQGEGVGLCFG